MPMKKEELLKTGLICTTILISVVCLVMSMWKLRATPPVISQGEHQQGVNALSVQGKGEVYAAPDMATLSISLSKTAPTTKEAQHFVATKMSEVQSLLKNFPIKAEDIQTQNITIGTEYDYGFGGGERKVKGYTATYAMALTLRELDAKKAKVLEDLINTLSGIEGVGIESLSYDIRDKTELFRQARSLAMEKAKQKAKELAKLGGVRIGKPIALSEEVDATPFFARKAMASQSNVAFADEASAEEGTSTIALGQLKVSVAINVSYPLM